MIKGEITNTKIISMELITNRLMYTKKTVNTAISAALGYSKAKAAIPKTINPRTRSLARLIELSSHGLCAIICISINFILTC